MKTRQSDREELLQDAPGALDPFRAVVSLTRSTSPKAQPATMEDPPRLKTFL
jgi:hypothetical protein